MKATGIVRKLDNLGRLVIPMEIRKNFNISDEDSIEIFVNENQEIILRKYDPNAKIDLKDKIQNKIMELLDDKKFELIGSKGQDRYVIKREYDSKINLLKDLLED